MIFTIFKIKTHLITMKSYKEPSAKEPSAKGPRPKEPSDLRNEGGMLSGPAAPLPFIFLMADSSSPIWSGAQLSLETDGAFRCFLICRLMSRSTCGMLSLLTLA